MTPLHHAEQSGSVGELELLRARTASIPCI